MSWGLHSSLERRWKVRRPLCKPSTKREIRHFHVVVVQWRQRNVQKKYDTRVVVLLNIPGAFLTFSLPSPLLLLSALLPNERSLLPNSSIGPASVYGTSAHGAWLERPNKVPKGKFWGSWSTDSNKAGQWLQIDLGEERLLTDFATQGGLPSLNGWRHTQFCSVQVFSVKKIAPKLPFLCMNRSPIRYVFAPAQELSGSNSDMNIASDIAVMSSKLKLRRAQSLGSIRGVLFPNILHSLALIVKTVNYAVYFWWCASYAGVNTYNKVYRHIYPSIPFVVTNCTLVYLESMRVLFQAE